MKRLLIFSLLMSVVCGASVHAMVKVTIDEKKKAFFDDKNMLRIPVKIYDKTTVELTKPTGTFQRKYVQDEKYFFNIEIAREGKKQIASVEVTRDYYNTYGNTSSSQEPKQEQQKAKNSHTMADRFAQLYANAAFVTRKISEAKRKQEPDPWNRLDNADRSLFHVPILVLMGGAIVVAVASDIFTGLLIFLRSKLPKSSRAQNLRTGLVVGSAFLLAAIFASKYFRK